MFRAFRTAIYDDKYTKLSFAEQQRVLIIEQQVKNTPYTGKPLGYEFFREKKFDGKSPLSYL